MRRRYAMTPPAIRTVFIQPSRNYDVRFSALPQTHCRGAIRCRTGRSTGYLKACSGPQSNPLKVDSVTALDGRRKEENELYTNRDRFSGVNVKRRYSALHLRMKPLQTSPEAISHDDMSDNVENWEKLRMLTLSRGRPID